MNYIVVPGTGEKVYPGTIVALYRFPGVKWVVKNDWYTYNGKQYQGWYFSQIPTRTILPCTGEDLQGLVVISGGGCPRPDPPGPGPGPCPPHPHPGPISPQMAWELDRAFITVDTKAERDLLNCRLIPDGKLVRVNDDGDGVPAYYEYDQANQVWVETDFGLSEKIDISLSWNKL